MRKSLELSDEIELTDLSGNILFVSSNHWDIVGAGWSGLKTFWVNRANQKEEILDYSADAKGKNLSDLQKFLCD